MVTHEEILDAVQARSTWENRQATWYKMRHDGLRRINKPFPGAADMHFPLGDMQIEKLKPFYLSQLYANDTIASFTSLRQENMSAQNEAALWFDYQLKQESNFEDELSIAVDKMLNCAVAPVKVYWCTEREKICFEAVNPTHLIVPAHTGRLAEADWIVHVQHYSLHAYKRLTGFDQSAETLAAIAAGESSSTANASYDQARSTREGITTNSKKDMLVVWEKYSRDEAGKWQIETYSPTAPTRPLRPAFGLPYAQGVFECKNPPPPFFEMTMERKDRGYYDPRSVMERLAPFEAALCKDWNTQKDYQTLVCNPVFTAENGVPNTANLRMVPGQILPFKLQAVQMPPIPVDIAQSMMGTRTVADQLIAAPDFGTGSQQQGRDNKTAKEVSLIASVMGQAADMRTRSFRRELGHGLRMAWALCLQYVKTRRDYFNLDGYAQVAPEALEGSYRIELNASGDNWNRGMVVQQEQALFQMFRGDPFINQEELRRGLLNAMDPRKTKKLLIGQGTQQAAQLEDQAQEISIMLLGYPSEVKETDDHGAHIQSIAGFTQRRATKGEPLPAEVLGLLAQHVAAHAQALQKANRDQWKAQGPQIQQYLQQLGAAAQQAAMQEQAAAQGGMMPGMGLGPPPVPAGQPQPYPV
jgi:hypothetical protein